MRFFFPYCIKPWVVNQEWGVFHEDPQNPGHSIYEKFGFTLHNGTDVALGADSLIRAPFSGTVVRAATKENGEWQPNGGGIFISLLSDVQYDFDDGRTAYVLADFLHCDHLIASDYQKVMVGDTLAVQDNTGFSTGPHTHIQLRRVNVIEDVTASYYVNGKHIRFEWVDANSANNSFDPKPYYTGSFAEAAPPITPASPSLIGKAISLLWQVYQKFYRSNETLQDMVARVCVEERLNLQLSKELYATIWAESNFVPTKTNSNNDGSADYGLCQLNSHWYIGSDKSVKTPSEAINNPEKCVHVMAKAFKDGRANDWVAHKTGAYITYMHLSEDRFKGRTI